MEINQDKGNCLTRKKTPNKVSSCTNRHLEKYRKTTNYEDSRNENKLMRELLIDELEELARIGA